MVTRVGWGSVAGKFSRGFLGTVVDQRFAGGGGRNQGGVGSVIQRSRQAQARLVETSRSSSRAPPRVVLALGRRR